MLGSRILATVLVFFVLVSVLLIHLVVNSNQIHLDVSLKTLGATGEGSKDVVKPFGESYRYVYLFIPASRIRELIGVRIDRLLAVPCYDDVLVVPVKLFLRGYTLTHSLTLNRSILIPDVGDATLTEEGILVLSIPIALDR